MYLHIKRLFANNTKISITIALAPKLNLYVLQYLLKEGCCTNLKDIMRYRKLIINNMFTAVLPPIPTK